MFFPIDELETKNKRSAFLTQLIVSQLIIVNKVAQAVSLLPPRHQELVHCQENQSSGLAAAMILTQSRTCGELWFVVYVYLNREKYNTIQDLKAAVKREWDAISVGEQKKNGGETNY
uniref:Uncharacterized protein n=1 Tax=Caenorhabditis japonica TaxID=281687 RepID=A0A8R1IN12_CAEJA